MNSLWNNLNVLFKSLFHFHKTNQLVDRKECCRYFYRISTRILTFCVCRMISFQTNRKIRQIIKQYGKLLSYWMLVLWNNKLKKSVYHCSPYIVSKGANAYQKHVELLSKSHMLRPPCCVYEEQDDGRMKSIWTQVFWKNFPGKCIKPPNDPSASYCGILQSWIPGPLWLYILINNLDNKYKALWITAMIMPQPVRYVFGDDSQKQGPKI